MCELSKTELEFIRNISYFIRFIVFNGELVLCLLFLLFLISCFSFSSSVLQQAIPSVRDQSVTLINAIVILYF